MRPVGTKLTGRAVGHVAEADDLERYRRASHALDSTQTEIEELERTLGIKAGETDKDLKYTLETVNCVGACALGPVVVANGEYHGKLDTQLVRKMIESLKK